MTKHVKLLTPFSILLQALGFFVLGLLFLRSPAFVARSLYAVLLIALSANAVLAFLSFVFVRDKRLMSTLATSGLSLLGVVAIITFPSFISAGIGIVVGIWVLINGLIRLAYAFQLWYTRSRGKARYIIEGVLQIALAVAMFVSPIRRLHTIYTIGGIYFMLYALTLLVDCARELFCWDIAGARIKKRIRVSPPLLLTAFLPARVAEGINRLLETERVEAEQLNQVNAPDGMDQGPLEVFFHFGKDVAMGFGHVDFCLNGAFYSYGCYDMDSHRFFDLISDGVLAVAPRERYIQYATQCEKKTLVGFVFYLTDEQTNKLNEAIGRILKTSKPWRPRENARNGHMVGGPIDMWERGGLRYHKLLEGPYQTYNTIRTNCVALAEMLVSETGLPLMQSTGIITPGTYYAYLNRTFARRNSIVVKKNVYTATASCVPEDEKSAVKQLDALRPTLKAKKSTVS